MRVVQVNHAYPPACRDGAALLDRYSTLTGWNEALLGAGASAVTVIQRFHRSESFARNGVQYVFVQDPGGDRPGMWDSCARVQDAASAVAADIVHMNGLVFPRQTLQLRRALAGRVAMVVQDHAARPVTGSWIRATVTRQALAAIDGFLFNSIEQAEAWRSAGLLPPTAVLGGVPESSTTIEPMSQDVARTLTELSGSPALLWVGRLNANKDPLTMLAGVRQAISVLPELSLTMIYSDETLLGDVKRTLAALPEFAGRVRLIGAVPHSQMSWWFSAADVFLSASHHEGSGYALIEAMACGVVPVVSDIPAFRALTRGCDIARRWRPGDACALAEALGHIGRLDLARARSNVREHFDRDLAWPVVGRQALHVYREVIARRANGAGPGVAS